MRPMDRPYRSVRSATLQNKPMHEVVRWIENYCRVLFPQNGIEYWTCDYRISGAGTTLRDLIDGFTADKRTRQQVVCYVFDGTCEGTRIELAMVCGEHIKCLASAKSFGSMDECWAVARAVYHAFEGILSWDEEPVLLDLVAMVPRRRSLFYTYVDDADIPGPLKARRLGGNLTILAGDLVVSQHPLDDVPGTAAWQVQSLLHDWSIVAKAFACDSSGLDLCASGYTMSSVTFDMAPDDVAIPAYLNGRRWNGWEMPFFPEESMERLMAVCPDVSYDAAKDAYMIDQEDGGDEPIIVYAETILLKDGRAVKAYPVGAGAWTWCEAASAVT